MIKFNSLTNRFDYVKSLREVPSSPNSPGAKGDMAADSSYLYVCYATNNWIRIPKDSTWISGFLLLEDGFNLLQENGDKIYV